MIGSGISRKTYEHARTLKNNLPRSERWFWKKWKACGLHDSLDMSNEVFLGFIPDVINHKYKYIIEVDGKIHKKPSIEKKDIFKKALFKKHGYAVFHVKAFCEDSFQSLLSNVASRKSKNSSGLKTILRRNSGLPMPTVSKKH